MMNLRRTHLGLILILAVQSLLPFGCRRQPQAKSQSEPATLTVLAAASLAETFTELGQAFEREHPQVRPIFSFAGSNQLRGQLEHGAPGDLFASANTKEIRNALEANVVDPQSVRTFARNSLAAIVPAQNPAALVDLRDLAKPGVKVLIADPAVPVGNYTVKMLELMAADPGYGPAFRDAVMANVRSREENVKAVLAKVRVGEGDVGFVYHSDAHSVPPSVIHTLPIPEAFNQTAEYPIAVTSQCKQPEVARLFIDFLLSAKGQDIMTRHGFIAVTEAER